MLQPAYAGFLVLMSEIQPRSIINKDGRVLSVLDASFQQACPDLTTLHAAMQQESALLPTTADAMRQKYEMGHAVILINETGEPVGYLGFTSLLDTQKKQAVGLPVDFPEVLEIGSAIILPKYRGGVYRAFRSAALELVLDGIKSGRTLVIGTTKNIAVIHANRHAREDLGIEFTEMVHTDLDAVAALTCVCHGTFGRGRQSSGFCPRRVTNQQLTDLDSFASLHGGKIPCVMYVSDIQLARQMNSYVIDHFGSIRNWIQALREIGHYD